MADVKLPDRPKTDARTADRNDDDLQRMLEAAAAGGSGADLSKMTDDEILRRLSRR